MKKINKRSKLNYGKTQVYLPEDSNRTACLTLRLINDGCRFCSIKISLVRLYSHQTQSLLRKPKIILTLREVILNPGSIFEIPDTIIRSNQGLVVVCRSKRNIIYSITGIEEHE